jgi:hypothetical protein
MPGLGAGRAHALARDGLCDRLDRLADEADSAVVNKCAEGVSRDNSFDDASVCRFDLAPFAGDERAGSCRARREKLDPYLSCAERSEVRVELGDLQRLRRSSEPLMRARSSAGRRRARDSDQPSKHPQQRAPQTTTPSKAHLRHNRTRSTRP